MPVFFYIALSLALNVFGQVVLKRATTEARLRARVAKTAPLNFMRHLSRIPLLYIGLFLYLWSSFFWLVALSRMDLSRAYPFTSLSYLAIFFISGVALKEKMVLKKFVGILIVIVGLFLSSI